MLEGSLLRLVRFLRRLIGLLGRLADGVRLLACGIERAPARAAIIGKRDIVSLCGHGHSERHVRRSAACVRLSHCSRRSGRQKRQGFLHAVQAGCGALRERIARFGHASCGIEQLAAYRLGSGNA